MTLSREKVCEKKKKRTKEEILGSTVFKRDRETEKANMDIKEELPNM